MYVDTKKRTWYSSKSSFTSPDTIHQILMFGTLSEIKALKKIMGENMIKELFLTHPKKIYTSSALNFIKKFVLNIKTPIDDQKYLKHASRYIG